MLLGPTEHVVPTRESRRIERRTARREKTPHFRTLIINRLSHPHCLFPTKKTRKKGQKAPFSEGRRMRLRLSNIRFSDMDDCHSPVGSSSVRAKWKGGGVPLTFILCSPARLPLEHVKGKTSSFFLHSARTSDFVEGTSARACQRKNFVFLFAFCSLIRTFAGEKREYYVLHTSY